MAQFCANKTSAHLEIFNNDNSSKALHYFSNNLPVDVTVEPITTCDLLSVDWSMEYRETSNHAWDYYPGTTGMYSPCDGIRLGTTAIQFLTSGFFGCAPTVTWQDWLGRSPGQYRNLQINSITVVTPGQVTGYRLKVKDASNAEVINLEFTNKPTYKVTCGCDIGQCEFGEYPKICCISPDEISNGIRTITQQLKQIKR